MYAYASEHHLTIKSQIEPVIRAYLSSAEPHSTLYFLNFIVFEHMECKSTLGLRIGSSRSIMIIQTGIVVEYKSELSVMSSFFTGLPNEVMGDFFLKMMVFHSDSHEDTYTSDFLLFVLQLILHVMEVFGSCILSRSGSIVSFTKTVLMNHVAKDVEEKSEGEEMDPLMLSLLLLDSIVKQGMIFCCYFLFLELVLNVEQQQDFDDILITLNTLETNNAEMKGLIRSIKLEMQTRNILSQPECETRESSLKIFQGAVLELKDDLLPLRAFAMSKLRHLVLSHDSVGKENINLITDLFIEQLSNTDRFSFLIHNLIIQFCIFECGQGAWIVC